MMSFGVRIKLLQYLLGFAFVVIVLGFASLIIGSVTGNYIAGINIVIGSGFFVTLLVAPFLTRAKCPRCGELFCGPQDEDVSVPGTNVFTRRCKYCDFFLP